MANSLLGEVNMEDRIDIGHSIQPMNLIEFQVTNNKMSECIMSINADTGDIIYRGRVITSDKEIAEALTGLIKEYRCTKCKESL